MTLGDGDGHLVGMISYLHVPPSLVDAARDYMAHSKAENTKIAYASDWRHFDAWCTSNGLEPLPATPQTVALYLTAHADILKVSTLQRRLASISAVHRQRQENFDTRHPALREVWAGIRRAKGTAPATKTPTLTNDIIAMVSNLPDTLIGARDRAPLLVGFAGAFRRSELVALEVGDLNASQNPGSAPRTCPRVRFGPPIRACTRSPNPGRKKCARATR